MRHEGMMLQGANIYILGRLGGSRKQIATILSGMGARLSARISSRVTHTIVTHAVAERFTGRIAGRPLSEITFKRILGIAPPPNSEGRGFTKQDVMRISGLGEELIDQLILFDVLDPCDNLFCFQDVASARTVARLLSDGISLSSVLATGARMRAKGMRISEVRLEGTSRDTLKLVYGDGLMTIDGQFELPLPSGDEDPDELLEQALALEDMEDWEEAERLYRMLCYIAPSGLYAFGLGNCLLKQGKTKEAMVAYMEANRRDRTLADPVFNIGTIHDDQGEIIEAIKAYKAALDIDPRHGPARFNLARLLMRIEEYEEALGHWNIIVSEKNDDSQVARKAALFCRMSLLSQE